MPIGYVTPAPRTVSQGSGVTPQGYSGTSGHMSLQPAQRTGWPHSGDVFAETMW
ncbi:hypothetical protein OV203_50340 [Nannocystis sp. ILAH1]|uniref:hypothetical protein n=1 Tax=Nannocystis sp. ILAH1 TaxID=2996789 RepID=UPI002270C098|nr:hypothetical protein [Nannocystis sp. ILAH1]MCY0995426.1 hypothetical protein [Nannocystis sp. ILAH1]